MIDALDIQDQLVSLLSADSVIISAFPNLVDPQTGLAAVQEDDPGGISQASALTLSLTPVMEDEQDGSLGGIAVGTAITVVTFAVLVYVWDHNRAPASKRTLVRTTSQVRQALMRYRTDNTSGNQLWYLSAFRRTSQGVTGYYSDPSGYRKSITFLDVSTRQRYS